MVKVNQGERRRVFEIQIESHRAGRQSIVGSAGNMNLLEATLHQLARAHQACIHQLLHPNIFDSAHSYIQLTFLLDQFFRPPTIHGSNPDFLPIKGTATEQGVSLFPRGRKQLVNRQCLQLLHLSGRKWVGGVGGVPGSLSTTH